MGAEDEVDILGLDARRCQPLQPNVVAAVMPGFEEPVRFMIANACVDQNVVVRGFEQVALHR